MPPKTRNSKRELENPGDVSISVAPAAPKKVRAQTGTATPAASAQAASSVNHEDGNLDLPELPSPQVGANALTKKKRATPRMKPVPNSDQTTELEEGPIPTSSTTKTRTAKAALTSAEDGE
jgi:hypothetical protein